MRYLTVALAAVSIAAPLAAQPATVPQVPAPQARVRVDFDHNAIRTIVADGPADPSGRKVTVDDPVRVASISKLVVALGVMRMVEAGKLDLDRDVSDYLGWRLRHPNFPDTPITLRLLLSHRSGMQDGGELYVIPADVTVRDRLSDPRVWDAAHAPGSFYRYTNLNFPVVAGIMERAGGERFDELMMRWVFRPLKIDACYNWSGCSPAKIARAVTLRNADGAVVRDDLKGKPPECLVYAGQQGFCDLSRYRLGDNGGMFSPQGGMRISIRDLARIGQLFLRNGAGFLTPASMATLAGPEWRFDGTNGVTGEGDDGGYFCAYGLAVQTLATRAPRCADDPFGDGRPRIGHSGGAYGLRSGLWIDRAGGKGTAYFLTAVPGDAPKGKLSAFVAPVEALIAVKR